MHKLDGPTITTDDMSHEKRVSLAKRMINGDGGISDIVQIKRQADSGDLSADPRTITTEHFGDTPEAALARVFKHRDFIESETEIDVSCELTGKTWEFPDTTFYEIDIHLNGGDE